MALFAAVDAPLTDLTNPADASHTRWSQSKLHDRPCLKTLFPPSQGPSWEANRSFQRGLQLPCVPQHVPHDPRSAGPSKRWAPGSKGLWAVLCHPQPDDEKVGLKVKGHSANDLDDKDGNRTSSSWDASDCSTEHGGDGAASGAGIQHWLVSILRFGGQVRRSNYESEWFKSKQ